MPALQQTSPIFAAIRFPWIGPITAQEWLPRLRSAGLHASITDESAEGFTIELTHPTAGSARLVGMADAPPVDDIYFLFAPSLSDKQRKRLLDGGYDITVVMQPRTGNILRDKKALYRFARAVMGNDALAMIDTFSSRVWLAADLDMELAHDADLDIEALYAIHAVQSEDPKHVDEDGEARCTWLHTHGLAELGGFDVDIVDPHPSFVHNSGDIIRALAFAMIDDSIAPDTEGFPIFYPDGEIDLVPVAEFTKHADPAVAALRDTEGHNENRSVLCQPRGDKPSGKWKVAPAKCLQTEMPDEIMSPFTKRATDLMAERARATVHVLQALWKEFADLQPHAIVKLGYLTDAARAQKTDDREHMWFEVHDLRADKLDATLLNQPIEIESMSEGDRGWHDLELITDWTLVTPAGNIDPRDMSAVRALRELPRAKRAELARAIAESKD